MGLRRGFGNPPTGYLTAIAYLAPGVHKTLLLRFYFVFNPYNYFMALKVLNFPHDEDYIKQHLKNFVYKASESDKLYIYEFVEIYIDYFIDLGEDRTWVQDQVLLKLTELNAFLELDLQE